MAAKAIAPHSTNPTWTIITISFTSFKSCRMSQPARYTSGADGGELEFLDKMPSRDQWLKKLPSDSTIASTMIRLLRETTEKSRSNMMMRSKRRKSQKPPKASKRNKFPVKWITDFKNLSALSSM
jgi:hypothetical protein